MLHKICHIRSPRILIAVLCAVWPTLSSAHEFWVEPVEWQVSKGSQIIADLRNGEEFAGSRLAWIDRNIARADIAFGDRVTPYTGRLGDRPALVTEAGSEGLATILHETTVSRITYKTWEKFAKFVAHKDLKIEKADHVAQGHPPEEFSESYTRHAKALVAVGGGSGADKPYGLETELVALTNPYLPEFDQNMRIQLFYENAPRIGAQVEIFERAPDDTVTIRMVTTDDEGIAEFPVSADHAYLLDAVLIRPGTVDGAIYDTLWASLSFFVPAR